jgi:hypothetical protein
VSRKGTRWDQVLFVLVAYRLLAPGSEWRLHREWFQRSALADLLGEDAGLAEIHKLYRCHDRCRRISLTMRLDDTPGDRTTAARPAIAPSGSEKRLGRAKTRAGEGNLAPASGGIAEAFRRAGLTGKAPGRR